MTSKAHDAQTLLFESENGTRFATQIHELLGKADVAFREDSHSMQVFLTFDDGSKLLLESLSATPKAKPTATVIERTN